MNAMLIDFYRHQAWADARHVSAIAAHEPARRDDVILNRLLHIYTVQRYFFWLAGDQSTPFAPPPATDITDFAHLQRLVRASHEEIVAFVDSVDDARLAQPASNPYAPDWGTPLTLLETLTQCPLHSHYHRGQNAARLRELGAEPPMTDLILWYWSGRPAPQWEAQ